MPDFKINYQNFFGIKMKRKGLIPILKKDHNNVQNKRELKQISKETENLSLTSFAPWVPEDQILKIF